MNTSTSPQQINPSVHDEHILVIKRDTLFGPHYNTTAWQGLKKVDFTFYSNLIRANQEFLPRSLMETDPTYKQIIPYLVFTYQDRYFLMQRHAHASEQRLQNKFSLGIGGHIRQEDITNGSILEWATREFHEEIEYSGTMQITPLGLLNDDSNAVGQVHIGCVFLLEGNSPRISVRSELKSGTLYSFDECKDFYPSMESWSKIVFDFIQETKV